MKKFITLEALTYYDSLLKQYIEGKVGEGTGSISDDDIATETEIKNYFNTEEEGGAA